MINKPLEQITELDLQALVNNKVTENKTIEYKQALPGNSDADKKEFLADVSSFANTVGGDLIFGIKENHETREPEAVLGFDVTNIDETKLRLESIIRDGLSPRIAGIVIKEVPLACSNKVIVIRVPRSWNSPHRVVYGGHGKFYIRSSNGKFPIDVGELRNAFTLSESIIEKIRNFRTERIANILADETPIPMCHNPKIVLHLIPISSFSLAERHDIEPNVAGSKRLIPIYASGWDERFNLDGRLAFSRIKDNKAHSYVQLYRNGIIEAVEGLLLEPFENKLIIPSVAYEREILSSTKEYLELLRQLGVGLPVVAMLTLINVKGYSMATSNVRLGRRESIDRNNLFLQEAYIEDFTVAADSLLKDIFNSIWNACGYERDLNYDENGVWRITR